MVWNFGDSFDLYTNSSDYAPFYWDPGGGTAFTPNGAGRFPGSRCLGSSAQQLYLIKSSNVNDGVHHLVVAYNQSTAIGGTGLGMYFTLSDGAAAQCTVVFRSDGAIILTSGIQTGTVLATYPGAVTATGIWYAFEFEVIINNTTGAFRVRKNGNAANDFDSGAGLNTRPGTTNNYANRVSIGNGGGNGGSIDDFYWRSDASAVAWIGDMRCYVRMPVTDASVQFSKFPTNVLVQPIPGGGNTGAATANVIRAATIGASSVSGTVTSMVCQLNTVVAGHAKMALYDATGVGGGPGTLLGQTTELTNPGIGLIVFPFTAGPTVQRGVSYWAALWSDVALTPIGNASTTDTLSLTYTTSFPATMAGFTTTGGFFLGSPGMNVTPFNAGEVNEPQQDALTSYVFDSTPGHADFYTIGGPIGSTTIAVVAVTTRAYFTKNDAGTRLGAVQLKSGATTVGTTPTTMIPGLWQWAWRTDIVDPNTGGAWAPTAVDSLQIGPVVSA